MFAFCFTSQAATRLLRSRNVRNNSRTNEIVVRAIRLGLVSLALTAVAGIAHAGGPTGKSFGGMMSRNSSNNNSSGGGSSFQFNNKAVTLGNVTKTMDYSSGRQHSPVFNKKIDGLGAVLNQTNNNQGTKITKKIDGLRTLLNKNNTLPFNKKLVDAVKKDNPTIHKKIPGLADLIKDKCHDKHCDPHHDHCFHHCPWWYCWDYPI